MLSDVVSAPVVFLLYLLRTSKSSSREPDILKLRLLRYFQVSEEQFPGPNAVQTRCSDPPGSVSNAPTAQEADRGAWNGVTYCAGTD